MAILLLVTLALFAVAQGRVYELPEGSEEWELFKSDYSKVYSTKSEEIQRMKIFKENSKRITEHNERYKKGLESFAMGINERSDQSFEELSARHSCLMNVPQNLNITGKVMTYKARRRLPASVDWRKKGAVTPVKDQNSCHSCWAFSVVGSLEGQHFLKYKKLVSLSEQNLVDCVPNYDCSTGFSPLYALQYIIQNGGINTENSYPYEAIVGECRFNPNKIGATVKDIAYVESGNEAALQQAVALHGPVAVTIHSPVTFDKYQEGVYDHPDCMGTVFTHAIVLVGYGTTKDGKDYWLVKNSWGTRWGYQGYGMIARNRNNMCGIASSAMYPVV